MTPIVLICGAAGSGKDTVAAFLTKNFNGICIAQADPMKRFAAKVFGFNEHKLWGPSEERNSPQEDLVETYSTKHGWDSAENRVNTYAHWMEDVHQVNYSVQHELLEWFNSVRHAYSGGGSPTPRYVLQTLGTEFGRAISKDMWSNHAIFTAELLLGGGYTYDKTKGLAEVKGAGYDHVVITDGRFRNEIINVQATGGSVVMIQNPEAGKGPSGGVEGHSSEAELTGIPKTWPNVVFINDKSKGLHQLEADVVNCLAGFLFREPLVLG